MNTVETIKNIVQEVLGVDMLNVCEPANLKYDLGASDIQVAEVANKIEKAFSIRLGFEYYDMTVEELIDLVRAEIRNKKEKTTAFPRLIHRRFACEALPKLAFSQPGNLFAKLRFKNEPESMHLRHGIGYLNELWIHLAQEMSEEATPPSGLDYEMIENPGQWLILFRFPEPEAVGEAYYALFVWSSLLPREEAAAYFICEAERKGMSLVQCTEDGQCIRREGYNNPLTPEQFMEEVLKKWLPRNDKSLLESSEHGASTSLYFPLEGLLEEEHIYRKILLALSRKLNVPPDSITKHTSVENVQKNDCMEIMADVYRMYGMDPANHRWLILQDVDRMIKENAGKKMESRFLLTHIARHFERRIAGDYDNPKALYLDYRKKMDLISQSPEFKLLYNPISKRYPSFITDNAVQVMLENRDLLYKEILSITESILARNYPVDPGGLFLCLMALGIAHVKYTHDEQKSLTCFTLARNLNDKWGPYLSSKSLEKATIR